MANQTLPFTINTTSGVISTNTALDRETTPSYSFLVAANDTVHTELVDVEIMVEDVNDNKPLFGGLSEFSIKENVGYGTEVGTIIATDKDKGEIETCVKPSSTYVLAFPYLPIYLLSNLPAFQCVVFVCQAACLSVTFDSRVLASILLYTGTVLSLVITGRFGKQKIIKIYLGLTQCFSL